MAQSESQGAFFNWVTSLIGAGGAAAYGVVFLMLFLAGWAFPLPEEPTVIAAGYVTKKNGLSLPLMTLAVLAGIQCGDLVIFWIGRRHGDWVFRLRLFRWLRPEERLAKARKLFAEHGSKMSFFGRFIAGVRLVVFFTAGNLGVPVLTFIAYDFLAILLTIPLGLFGGYYFAEHIDQAFALAKKSHKFAIGGALALVALYFLVHWIHKKVAGKRFAVAEAPPPAASPLRAAEQESKDAPKSE